MNGENSKGSENPDKIRRNSSKRKSSDSPQKRKKRSSAGNDVEVTAEINMTDIVSDNLKKEDSSEENNKSKHLQENGKKTEEKDTSGKVNGAMSPEINDEITKADTVDNLGFAKMTGEEDLDALSTLSFKEKKDFKYYFQHPYLRLFVAYFVTFCNFLIYAEDPVAHSMKECNIPLVGSGFAFVCTRYPSNAWSLLKVVLWIAGIITGMLIGKILVHKLFFCKCM